MSFSPPTGLVTFLFSDIEGSTRLWETNSGLMYSALNRHDALMRRVIESHGGYVFKTVGDGFFASFSEPTFAVQAAIAAQLEVTQCAWETEKPIKVRMALHSGKAEFRDNDYFGTTLNRLARLLSVGHGGQILLSEASAAMVRNQLPEGCLLRELGRHRLKDLDQPEGISMLLHPELLGEFPPLKSLDSMPNNLPRQLTSFVGRSVEREKAIRLLESSALVTMTGPGGTGKTRLALQVGAELLEHYSDGAWLVELAPITDPALVSQAVANVLNVREGANLSVTRALVDCVRDKSLLLILDNCEHLVGAVAQIVAELLQAAPKLKVLATSREPIGISGEAQLRIPSMDVGASSPHRTFAEAMEIDAVRLFFERATLGNPNFEITDKNAPVVVAICRRLDGIPLAIELAASRVKVLSLDQIAARLDDRFRLLTAGVRTALPRQQTLRATIDWSFDLLDPIDQIVLRRVAVFSGGWTLEAAELVCQSEDLESWEVMDGLIRLVDKSLVIHDQENGEGRYRLLETVRQYGREKCATAEWEAIQAQHAEYFANMVIAAEDGLLGVDQMIWLERLEREHDNIRALLAYSQTRPDLADRAILVLGAIGRFWTVRGYLTEGRDWIERILSCASPEATKEKATAWRTAGQLAYWQGDAAAGRKFGEESLKVCLELSDVEGETRSRFRLGFVCLSDGDLVNARAYFEEALKLGRQLNDRPGIPHLLNAVGEVALAEGNHAEAREHFELALQGFGEFKDRRSIASVLKNLSILAGSEGDFSTAHRYLCDGLAIRRELGNLTGIAVTLDAFAVLAAAQKQYERSVYLVAAAHSLHETHGSRSEPSEAAKIELLKSEADAAMGREAFDQVWEQGLQATVDESCTRALREEPTIALSV